MSITLSVVFCSTEKPTTLWVATTLSGTTLRVVGSARFSKFYKITGIFRDWHPRLFDDNPSDSDFSWNGIFHEKATSVLVSDSLRCVGCAFFRN